ncbi:hypothetical protein D3C78_1200190 [compost metagenome]
MQDATAVIFITHIDKVDDDNAAEIAQAQLARDRLGRFNIGVENRVVKIAVTNKRTGIDINGSHRFGLIDDQIAARFQLDFALQRALDFVFDIKEIENRLTARIVFQQARHLRDVFGGKFQQCIVRQTRVDANSVELRIGKIPQHALGQR